MVNERIYNFRIGALNNNTNSSINNIENQLNKRS